MRITKENKREKKGRGKVKIKKKELKEERLSKGKEETKENE